MEANRDPRKTRLSSSCLEPRAASKPTWPGSKAIGRCAPVAWICRGEGTPWGFPAAKLRLTLSPGLGAPLPNMRPASTPRLMR